MTRLGFGVQVQIFPGPFTPHSSRGAFVDPVWDPRTPHP